VFRVFGIGFILTIALLAMNVTPTLGTETIPSQQALALHSSRATGCKRAGRATGR
jgi:hypothetical protein